MTLRLHNQLTKQVDALQPLVEGRVSLYTCGPTVYNYLHVGNWAAYIYWDTLVRVLEAHHLNVTRVMNITDVGHLVSDGDDGEDKLEKVARREGKTAWEVAAFYTDDFLQGMKKLGLRSPQHVVKATDFIPQQLQLIRRLKEKGHTYQISDGIYFDTATFPTYADFAGLQLDHQVEGARVAHNPEKRQASDFALWKFSPGGQSRDMEWETPVDLTDDGIVKMGFPGWHLECSAMALDILGDTLDIHTGGIDHIPVHHTNEIAQSESATGKQFSRFWLHNNHLQSNGTKISKSLDNGYTLDDVVREGYDPLDLRLFVLQSHYRSEGKFSFENLTSAANRRHHWRAVAALRHQVSAEGDTTAFDAAEASSRLLGALSDDLNTPAALTVIDDVFETVPQAGITQATAAALTTFTTTIDALLGLGLADSTPDISDEAKAIMTARQEARSARDWTRSDELRAQLEEIGIAVRDTDSQTFWYYA